jgi:hypothetical protein
MIYIESNNNIQINIKSKDYFNKINYLKSIIEYCKEKKLN